MRAGFATPAALAVTVCLAVGELTSAQQRGDPDYQLSVTKPAYRIGAGPVVAIDEAHRNGHTASGTYAPFAELLRADGYTVRAFTSSFSAEALQGVRVLVVANARSESGSAAGGFTEPECDAVQEWVRAGGALLLVADHAPAGEAADLLARHFGVLMGRGFAFLRPAKGPLLFDISFSAASKTLGEHPIIRGRTRAERVKRVDSFEGQSLAVPAGAIALLRFGNDAWEATQADVRAEAQAAIAGSGKRGHAVQIGGRAQGLAVAYGNGRVVVLGEAAMLTAQVFKSKDGTEQKFGMNVPGNDNRQFTLNVLHWLSGLLSQ